MIQINEFKMNSLSKISNESHSNHLCCFSEAWKVLDLMLSQKEELSVFNLNCRVYQKVLNVQRKDVSA